MNMTSKELTVLGKALKALIKAGLMDEVAEIVDFMAETDKSSGSKESK